MLPPLGSEPRHWLSSDFHVLHATTELIQLFAGSLSPLDPYAVMLYRFKKNAKTKNQHAGHESQRKVSVWVHFLVGAKFCYGIF